MLAVVSPNEALSIDNHERKSAMKTRKTTTHKDANHTTHTDDHVVQKARKKSLLRGDDEEESQSEYEEEMDELFLADKDDEKKRNEGQEPRKEKRSSRNRKELENMDQEPGRPAGVRRSVSTTGSHGKLKRSTSMDGLLEETKRHSWDAGKQRKPRPDFRWDKVKSSDSVDDDDDADTSPPATFRWDKFQAGAQSKALGSPPKRSSSPEDDKHDTSSGSTPPKRSSSPKNLTSPKSRPQLRVRRTPRRTKSLDYRRPQCLSLEDKQVEKTGRPTLIRTDSKVRFCLDSNVCFEVPRPTKDLKPDLFYTKREIKTFKAERKEEKNQKREQKKLEKLKKEQTAATADTSKPAAGDEEEDESVLSIGLTTPIATC